MNGSSPSMFNVVAAAMGIQLSYNYGVSNQDSSPVMNGVVATATGGQQSSGVLNFGSSPILINVTANGSGATSGNNGMENYAEVPTSITVDRSSLTGSRSIYNASGITVRIGSSKLVGSVEARGGTISCVASYNGNYTPLDATCQ